MRPGGKARLIIGALRAQVRHRILGDAVGVLYETKNGTIVCPPYDDTIARHLGTHHEWDTAKLDELLALIDETSNVLVVGAHLGLLAIPLAKKARECVAIEANRRTFSLLELNKRLNLVSNLRCMNVAAGEATGRIEFVESRANTGGSKRAPKHKDWIYYYDGAKTTSVDLVALDDALRGETFDLVVMDIEGSEYFALQGMGRLLAACKHLQIEYLPHHVDRVAGTTDVEFLRLLEPHFSRVRVAGEPGESERSAFASFLANVRARGGADLLFSK